MAINCMQCTRCGSKNTLTPTRDDIEKTEADEMKLDGDHILVGDSEYYCKNCKNEWNKEQIVHAKYAEIKGIKASVGGYFGGYYIVEVNLITHHVSWSFLVGEEDETLQKTIRPATAKRFIEELKLINLLNWQETYIEPGVLDGTSWSVEIIKNSEKIRKHGSNKFPDKWDDFCELIRKMTGKKFS